MTKKSLVRTGIWVVALSCGLVSPFQDATFAKNQAASNQHKSVVRKKSPIGSVQRKFEVGRALNLELRQCTGVINFLGANVLADGVDIADGQISLLSGAAVVKRGEVIAYAQSQYFLDANVALIFDRSDKRFSDPEWARPSIISLNMIQSRTNPKEFTFTPIPTGNSEVAKSVIHCASFGGKLASAPLIRGFALGGGSFAGNRLGMIWGLEEINDKQFVDKLEDRKRVAIGEEISRVKGKFVAYQDGSGERFLIYSSSHNGVPGVAVYFDFGLSNLPIATLSEVMV